MRLGFLTMAFALTLLPFATRAADKPIVVIKDSLSPDGSKDIVVVESNEPSPPAGTAEIREVKTGRILGTFSWACFGGHPDPSFKVLWRHDSRCFSMNWEQTRGFVGCAVYIQSRSGWVQVELPGFGQRAFRLARVVGPAHISIDKNWGGKGHETALGWLSGNRLRIETGYRGISTLDVDGEWQQLFWFTLKLTSSAAKTKPRATVETIRLAPSFVYHQ